MKTGVIVPGKDETEICNSDERIYSRAWAERKNKVIHLHEVGLAQNNENIKRKHAVAMNSTNSGPAKSREAQIKKIFDAIVYYARQSNFTKAEQLHTRLVEEAPDAVPVIVKAAEIIEERKKIVMDPEKIQPWADLFNRFTSSEAAAFYFALRDFAVRPHQPVFQQGNCDTRLYFIRSGRLKLKYFDYNVRKNVAIGVLGRGDIAGIETFFTLTNHTTNLIAAEASNISYLEKADYQKIVIRHHGIEPKLFNYCEAKRIEMQKRQERPQNLNRRAHHRFKTELTGVIHRLNPNGHPDEEKIKGKIMDISSGGLGFLVKEMEIGKAACLHNSRILVSTTYNQYGLNHDLKKVGTVVSLKFLPMGECSVHIQFEEPMDEDRVMAIAHNKDVIAYI